MTDRSSTLEQAVMALADGDAASARRLIEAKRDDVQRNLLRHFAAQVRDALESTERDDAIRRITRAVASIDRDLADLDRRLPARWSLFGNNPSTSIPPSSARSGQPSTGNIKG